MGCQEIIAGTTGRDKAMGVVEFVMQDGPVTLCRATQDAAGNHKVALIQGAVESNQASTFGAYGWVRIPGIQNFYKNVLLRHFPHHVAMTRAPWATSCGRRSATTWTSSSTRRTAPAGAGARNFRSRHERGRRNCRLPIFD